MTDTTRRHPNVVNVSELEASERGAGTRFLGTSRALAAAAGAQSLGCSWFEVPPGHTAMPCHFHCANEEAVFVLEGEGTLRIGDSTVPVRPGDWISFPVGPQGAHQLLNTGTGPLRYLALSTQLPTDVVGYPDSGKILAWAERPGVQEQWVRHMTELEAAVDYYHREDVSGPVK